MKDTIIVGIDIGTANTRTIIAQHFPDAEIPRVIGVGVVPSVGIRRGIIVDPEEVVRVINESVEKAERMAGTVVRDANVSVGGTEISFQEAKGVIAVGRADGEVTEEDMNRVLEEAQAINPPLNKEIVHVIPRSYRLDDQEGIKDPLGMKGVRLEVGALIIESSSSHVKNLRKCIYQSGIEMNELILEPLAAAEAVLSKKQKELGVVLVNIGGGTTSLAVYEESELLHANVLPIGAGHITNDIAIGLRTSVEVAEKIKLEYGSAIAEGISKKEDIDLSKVDSQESEFVSRFHVAEIIEARLMEIFELVQKELKSIGKSNLLPSGAILTGGGAKLPNISELAKEVLGLPAQVGFPINLAGIMNKVDDASFATAIGLVIWNHEQQMISQGTYGKGGVLNNFSKNTGNMMKKIRHLMERFLP